MYEEVAAPAFLRGVVRCVWRSASEGAKRIVPDGCVDLVVGGGQAFVAGPDTGAWSSVTEPGVVLSGVRFVPGRAAAVLGVAADELRDRRVPLDELWGRRSAERLVEGAWSPVSAVAERVAEPPPVDPAVAELIARLEAGVARVGEATRTMFTQPGSEEPDMARADVRPAELAARAAELAASPPELTAAQAEDPPPSTAVSDRQLRRRFTQAVGYGPATYLRISRFQRAVALAPRLSGLAALAAAAGYADQAHLSRDCRALTGLTPRLFFP
ncbi:helix-turn-helix domain-containing protein [Amycolatopsis sp. Hca4]|uniref:helix-turn-helix domain-containing protein n=1 Tax=Amycolatopsis sp. Hca4 TaxID=2742131 RepID=UPI0020CB4537|nr:helix-turn-helix domain-containing protein [Amycolatopsis sp. Hca4]